MLSRCSTEVSGGCRPLSQDEFLNRLNRCSARGCGVYAYPLAAKQARFSMEEILELLALDAPRDATFLMSEGVM